jgi:hypothetical protein
MRSFRERLLTATALLLLLTLAGCGGDAPSIVEVNGTLTYKGQPVPNASLRFMPAEGRMSVGDTDEQGHFKLTYDAKHPGAVVGKHKVSVKMRPMNLAESEAQMMGKKVPLSKDWEEFFDKYSQAKSTVEVTIDRNNATDLKLEWN